MTKFKEVSPGVYRDITIPAISAATGEPVQYEKQVRTSRSLYENCQHTDCPYHCAIEQCRKQRCQEHLRLKH